ncbi:hypothetical protein GCM10009616_35990 [Microlunatus lacustris]
MTGDTDLPLPVADDPPTVVRSLLVDRDDEITALRGRIHQLQTALDSALAEAEARGASTAELALEAVLAELADGRPRMRLRALDAIRRTYISNDPEESA